MCLRKLYLVKIECLSVWIIWWWTHPQHSAGIYFNLSFLSVFPRNNQLQDKNKQPEDDILDVGMWSRDASTPKDQHVLCVIEHTIFHFHILRYIPSRKAKSTKCSHVVRMEDKIKLVQRWESLWASTDAPSKLPKVSLIRWDVRNRGVRRHHFLWWGLGTSTPRLHSWPEKPIWQQTQTFLLMML